MGLETIPIPGCEVPVTGNAKPQKVELRGIEPRSEPCKGPVLPLNYGPVTALTTPPSAIVCHTSACRRDRTATAAATITAASRGSRFTVHLRVDVRTRTGLHRGPRRTRTSDLFVISEAL